MTQTQVAARLGLPQHYVSRYELGDRHLDVFELDAICRALDTTLVEVWTQLASNAATQHGVGTLPIFVASPEARPASPRFPSARSTSRQAKRRTQPPISAQGKAPLARTMSVGADAARRVERARALLERPDEEPPSVEAVAASVGWGADHLRRMFGAVLGVSPSHVQMTARLQRARTLILEGQMPVASVANRCGFVNASHFAKAFKREFGLSPRELKRAQNASFD